MSVRGVCARACVNVRVDVCVDVCVVHRELCTWFLYWFGHVLLTTGSLR